MFLLFSWVVRHDVCPLQILWTGFWGAHISLCKTKNANVKCKFTRASWGTGSRISRLLARKCWAMTLSTKHGLLPSLCTFCNCASKTGASAPTCILVGCIRILFRWFSSHVCCSFAALLCLYVYIIISIFLLLSSRWVISISSYCILFWAWSIFNIWFWEKPLKHAATDNPLFCLFSAGCAMSCKPGSLHQIHLLLLLTLAGGQSFVPWKFSWQISRMRPFRHSWYLDGSRWQGEVRWQVTYDKLYGRAPLDQRDATGNKVAICCHAAKVSHT